MVHAQWGTTCRKNIVCVDSYNDRIFRGRFYNPQRRMESFSSLTQFLVSMEKLLDEMQVSSAPIKAPASALPLPSDEENSPPIRKGARATFELQVLFRQHTSWQGILKWREKNVEHSFRSALELVLLMDDALESCAEVSSS